MLITTEKKNGVIQARLDGNLMSLLRAMPGRKKWVGRDLYFEPTGANIKFIRETFPDATWDSKAESMLSRVINVEREAERTTVLKKESQIPVRDFLFKTKPFAHQEKAFMMSRDLKAFALLMEMGTGKTKVIIDTSAYLYGKGEIDVMLVVAPNGVHRNWVLNELPLHMPDHVPYKAAWYASGLKKHEEQKLNSVIKANPDEYLRVVTVNIEAFSGEKGVKFVEKLLLSGRCMMVIDESSRLKTPGSKRTQSITRLGRYAKYRRILTGTPVTQGPEDLFSQFRFLDEDILGYGSFYSFRNHFCVLGGFNQKQIVGYRNLDELKNAIDGHSFRVLKEDCLDLPDKIYSRRYVELTTSQKHLYETLKREFIIEFNGSVISAPLAVTRLLRLQQVVCGWLPGEDGSFHPIDEHNPRVDTLLDVFDEAQGSAIVWCRFTSDVLLVTAALEKKYGKNSVVTYYGSVSSSDRDKAVSLFQTGGARFFVGNPHAAGIGLTLTAASVVVYYSNDFSLETRLQSEDRAHRIGQKNNVQYIDIEAVGTVDKKIVNALRTKKDLADLITGDAKRFIAEIFGEDLEVLQDSVKEQQNKRQAHLNLFAIGGVRLL